MDTSVTLNRFYQWSRGLRLVEMRVLLALASLQYENPDQPVTISVRELQSMTDNTLANITPAVRSLIGMGLVELVRQGRPGGRPGPDGKRVKPAQYRVNFDWMPEERGEEKMAA